MGEPAAALTPWALACPDWADRLRAGRSLLPALPLDADEAGRAVAIFNRLRLPDVPGQPTLGEVGGEWQRDIVRALFGSWDAERQTRHIREVFQLVPKKNSKTTGGAAVMLTAVLMSDRPRAEFLIIAPTIDVAKRAFDQAVGMVEADPVLRAKFLIQEHRRTLTYRPTKATLRILSFDPKTVTGSKPAGVLIDELHVIAEHHDADRVIGQLRGGMVSQPEAFLLIITTQSERQPAGVFRAELRKARDVRDGKLEAPILPLLYEFPAGVDWRDPAHWPMVLPNVGRSLTIERLESEFRAAQAGGPEELTRWASQHLDVEIGLALRTDGWAGAAFWWAAGKGPSSLRELLERCEVVTVGVDGGGLDDMLGLAVVGRERVTGRWLAWAHAWAHPIVLERRTEIAAQLRDFERDGDLTFVERVGDDVEQVADSVERCEAAGLLDMIGVDTAGIGSIVDAIVDRGIEQDRIKGIPQGWRLNGAIQTAERRLAGGTLLHGGRALMAWCVGNARVETHGNAILITKQASGRAKIDPLMATLNAVALMALNPQARNTPEIVLL